MSNTAARHYTTFEDYLEAEQGSEQKHEWWDGVVHAMSRGTPEHARLAASITRIVGNALVDDCNVYSSDAMLYVEKVHLTTYADGSIVCGPVVTIAVQKNGRSLGEAIANPTVVIEVLSGSTEDYDRAEKFAAYRQLPSLHQYVLVAQDERRVEVFTRETNDTWSCETGRASETIAIHGAQIRIDDIYR